MLHSSPTKTTSTTPDTLDALNNLLKGMQCALNTDNTDEAIEFLKRFLSISRKKHGLPTELLESVAYAFHVLFIANGRYSELKFYLKDYLNTVENNPHAPAINAAVDVLLSAGANLMMCLVFPRTPPPDKTFCQHAMELAGHYPHIENPPGWITLLADERAAQYFCHQVEQELCFREIQYFTDKASELGRRGTNFLYCVQRQAQSYLYRHLYYADMRNHFRQQIEQLQVTLETFFGSIHEKKALEKRRDKYLHVEDAYFFQAQESMRSAALYYQSALTLADDVAIKPNAIKTLYLQSALVIACTFYHYVMLADDWFLDHFMHLYQNKQVTTIANLLEYLLWTGDILWFNEKPKEASLCYQKLIDILDGKTKYLDWPSMVEENKQFHCFIEPLSLTLRPTVELRLGASIESHIPVSLLHPNELLTKVFAWQTHREELISLRRKITEKLAHVALANKPAFDNDYSHFVKLRSKFTRQLYQFIYHIIQTKIDLLGLPKCLFLFLLLGSLGRKEPCLFSDFEFALVLDDDTTTQTVHYFELLVSFVEHIIIALQESFREDLPVIFRKGFRFDELHVPFAKDTVFVSTVTRSKLNNNRVGCFPKKFMAAHEALPDTLAEALMLSEDVLFNPESKSGLVSISILLDALPLMAKENRGKEKESDLDNKGERDVDSKREHDVDNKKKSDLVNRYYQSIQEQLNLPLERIEAGQRIILPYTGRELFALKLIKLSLEKERPMDRIETCGQLDSKKQFLRQPTLILKTLAIYYDIALSCTNSVERAEALCQKGAIAPDVVVAMRELLVFGDSLRFQAHAWYQEEEDTVYLDRSQAPEGSFILSKAQQKTLFALYEGVYIPCFKAMHAFVLRATEKPLPPEESPFRQPHYFPGVFLYEELKQTGGGIEIGLKKKDEHKETEFEPNRKRNDESKKKKENIADNEKEKQKDDEIIEKKSEVIAKEFAIEQENEKGKEETKQKEKIREKRKEKEFDITKKGKEKAFEASTINATEPIQKEEKEKEKEIHPTEQEIREKTIFENSPSLSLANFLYHCPTPEARRLSHRIAKQDWEKVLMEEFTEAYHPEQKAIYKKEKRVVVQWLDPHKKRVTRLLKTNVAEQLLNPQQTFDETKQKNNDGRRIVIPINNNEGNPIAYAKAYPELPGVQLMVDDVSFRISGYGNLATLCKFIPLGSSTACYPVMLGKAAGETLLNLRREGRDSQDIEAKLDHYAFTCKLLETLVICPGDDKEDNVTVEFFINSEGKLVYRVVSVDPDHAWSSDIVKMKEKEFVNVKTVLYCFKDKMQQPLHPRAVAEFLSLNPYLLFNDWLTDMAELQEALVAKTKEDKDALFTLDEIATWSSDKKGWLETLRLTSKESNFCFIPLFFETGTVRQLYQRFRKLQQALMPETQPENSLKIASVPKNGMDIVRGLSPRLVAYYDEANENHATVAERFDALPMDYEKVPLNNKKDIKKHSSRLLAASQPIATTNPSSSLPSRHKTTTPGERIVLGALATVQCHDIRRALIRDCFIGPQQCLKNDLPIVYRYYRKIDKYLKKPYAGNIEHFIKMQNVDAIKEHIINRLQWQRLEPAKQVTLLKAIQGISFQRLLLNHCEELTDTLLENILRGSPDLQILDISHCIQLTDKAFQLIARYSRVLQVLHANGLPQITVVNDLLKEKNIPLEMPWLTELTLNDCSGLKIINLKARRLIELSVSDCQELSLIDLNSNQHSNRLRSIRISRCLELSTVSVQGHEYLLDISSSLGLTDERLKGIVVHCRGIARLNLRGCPQITFPEDKSRNPSLAVKSRKELRKMNFITIAKSGYREIGNFLISEDPSIINLRDEEGYTALMHIVKEGQLAAVQWLVTLGADIHVAAHDSATAFILAISLGHDAIIQYLEERGAKIDADNQYAINELVKSAWRGEFEIVKQWLRYGVNVNGVYAKIVFTATERSFMENKEIIRTADKEEHKGILGKLRKRREQSTKKLVWDDLFDEFEVPSYDDLGEEGLLNKKTAFDKNKYKKTIDYLQKRYARPHTHRKKLLSGIDRPVNFSLLQDTDDETWLENEETRFCNKKTALLVTLKEGHFELADYLFEHGASLEIRYQHDYTALMFAAKKGHLKMTQWLVAHGTNLHATTEDGANALVLAIFPKLPKYYRTKSKTTQNQYYSELIGKKIQGIANRIGEYLLEHGAKLSQNRYAIKKLIEASMKGDLEEIKRLLYYGTDVNAKAPDGSPYYGNTAFLAAFKNGHMELADYLFEQRADLQATDDSGSTALMHSTANGKSESVQWLVAHGVINTVEKIESGVEELPLLLDDEEETENSDINYIANSPNKNEQLNKLIKEVEHLLQRIYPEPLRPTLNEEDYDRVVALEATLNHYHELNFELLGDNDLDAMIETLQQQKLALQNLPINKFFVQWTVLIALGMAALRIREQSTKLNNEKLPDDGSLAILAGGITEMIFPLTIRTSCEIKCEEDGSYSRRYLLSADLGFFKTYFARRNGFWAAVKSIKQDEINSDVFAATNDTSSLIHHN